MFTLGDPGKGYTIGLPFHFFCVKKFKYKDLNS